jgi:hypothetical protein
MMYGGTTRGVMGSPSERIRFYRGLLANALAGEWRRWGVSSHADNDAQRVRKLPLFAVIWHDKVDFSTTTITITWRRQHHNHQHHHPPFHPLTRSPTHYQHHQHQHHFVFRDPLEERRSLLQNSISPFRFQVHETSKRPNKTAGDARCTFGRHARWKAV